MPFVNIRLVKEVIADNPAQKKAEISRAVSAALATATGLPPEEVWIVFEEVNARDWFLGQKDVETLRFKK